MTEITQNTVLIYMTTVTSTVAILKKQRAIVDFCEAKKIPHAQIDMCSDIKARPKMLSLIPQDRKNETGPILPPQVFVGESYCGDFEDFEFAKEMDLSLSFFKREAEEGSAEYKTLMQYKKAGKMPPFYPRGFSV